MHWSKRNSCKGNVDDKILVSRIENRSQPPYNFSNGPSLKSSFTVSSSVKKGKIERQKDRKGESFQN